MEPFISDGKAAKPLKPQILLSMPAARFPNYDDALTLAGGALTDREDEAQALVLPGGGDLDPARYGQQDLGACAGVDPQRDARELELCRRFLDAGRPVLGICRGAQVLAVALGGTLRQDLPGHDALPGGGDRIHDTRTAGVLTALYGPECPVNSSHHQAVERMPAACRILQISCDGVIEAFAHETLPALAVQWHPERLCGRFARPDAVSGLPLLRYFLSLCPEATP